MKETILLVDDEQGIIGDDIVIVPVGRMLFLIG